MKDNTQHTSLYALGLMSGTSLDGIDLALITTDGESVSWFGPTDTIPYSSNVREKVRATLGGVGDTATAELLLTKAHIVAARNFLNIHKLLPSDIDLIGFHGHTIMHTPSNRKTWQIGDGKHLAKELETDVVADFRSADVSKGGEGAPLAPVFHRALAKDLAQPVCVLNVGGVANLTWICGASMIAFDTGPGNALIDDWIRTHTGRPMDFNGTLAAAGQVSMQALSHLLKDPYFEKPAPKSLDRNHFSRHATDLLENISLADGASTLTTFTAESIKRALEIVPRAPKQILVCGGGRKNNTLMVTLQNKVAMPVNPVETVGWSGDAMEAQLVAFLAARSFYQLPLSFPTTTGVSAPTTGGRFFSAN